MPVFLDRELAVHDYGVKAKGMLVWVLVVGSVEQPFWVEDDDVGVVPFLEQATMLEPSHVGRFGGHLSHGFLERHELLAEDVPAEKPGRGSV